MENNKIYETPEAEKMMFNYRDQVVAASINNYCEMVSVREADIINKCVESSEYMK